MDIRKPLLELAALEALKNDNANLRTQLAAAIAERERAVKDAARWRYVRGYSGYRIDHATPEDWDRRIDTRMAEDALIAAGGDAESGCHG